MQLFTVVFLALYLLLVLSIGFLYRRRAGRDEVSYFIADRSLSTFWGFLGLASLTTGGSTTIVLAAFVYANGVSGLWLDLAGAFGLAALGVFLAARVRREGAVTLPEIVGRHYGPGARRARLEHTDAGEDRHQRPSAGSGRVFMSSIGMSTPRSRAVSIARS